MCCDPGFHHLQGTAFLNSFNLLSKRRSCSGIRAAESNRQKKGSRDVHSGKGRADFLARPLRTKPYSNISEPLKKTPKKTLTVKPFPQDNVTALPPVTRADVEKPRPTSKKGIEVLKEADSESEQSGARMGKGDKQQRTAPKELSLRSSNARAARSISYLQIIGTGMDTEDTAPSVLLFFDNKRFVFNAGEGLQRFCVEHKVKLTKIDHIFLTRVCSETTGGLAGALLTLAGEVGMAVNIWGPSDLRYLVDAMRLFVPQASMFHIHSFGEEVQPASPTTTGHVHGSEGISQFTSGVIFEEEVVKISAVLLYPMLSDDHDSIENITVRNSNVQQCMVSCADEKPGKMHKEQSPTRESSISDASLSGTSMDADQASDFMEPPDVKAESLSMKRSCRPGEISVVYVCELPEVKGKFDPAKAASLGLKKGPKYGRLQDGETVMSDDGKRMVHPSDVMDPSSPGPIFVLVDCPTIEHIPSLLSAPYLRRFYGISEVEEMQKLVTCMIHIGPKSVTQDARYLQWMHNFVGTQHIMAGHGSHSMSSPVLKSSAKLLARLNCICPQIFPISHSLMSNSGSLEEEAAKYDDTTAKKMGGSGTASIVTAKNLLKFRLRPLAAVGLDQTSVPEEFSIKEIQDSLAAELPEVIHASKEIGQLWNALHERSGYCDMSHEATKVRMGIPEGVNILEDIAMTDFRSKDTGTLHTSHEADATDGVHVPSISNLQSSGHVPDSLNKIDRKKLEIVFLGTGSSQPSKYRNVSAIYLHLFDCGGLLLDCGEGTYAQLKRRFGIEGADTIVENLKCIWVSHIHADHHSGLARILSVRAQILKKQQKFVPLIVVGPKQLKWFLEAYGRLEELGMHFLDCSQTTQNADVFDKESAEHLESRSIDTGTLPNEEMEELGSLEVTSSDSTLATKRRRKDDDLGSKTGGFISFKTLGQRQGADYDRSGQVSGQLRSYWLQPGFHLQKGLDTVGREKLKNALSELGLLSLTSIPVIHCPQAFGIVVEAQTWSDDDGMIRPGWKLAYSGDTRPCKALQDAAQGATVLIHEATFDDGMLEEALSKNHSLTCEAIETGIAAGAYRTILTHFSQRYPKIPVFDNSYNDRTCVAFDMMSVNIADLPILPKLVPALKLLFKDQIHAEDEQEYD
ncbi:hypothetical protein O6H91_04G059400 [Diphasiastrum complanatum]|uniref:Uncharacterized protein n=1 Tax=Diphasiastrum complanatum TaxID=34168 RepID=A0ACC2DX44_DIPCM|nr:hypothetical protein O6H91_04G059400 [Diphasiastrum complanatum]